MSENHKGTAEIDDRTPLSRYHSKHVVGASSDSLAPSSLVVVGNMNECPWEITDILRSFALLCTSRSSGFVGGY